jgi:hypothetical protein
LAGFRCDVDVAVVLGFRSTPRNGSRFSLLLPRMTVEGDGVHDARPISATRKSASAELVLQRSTVQHPDDQPADAERVPRELLMQVRMSFSGPSYHLHERVIGHRALPTRFRGVFPPRNSFPSSQSHGLHLRGDEAWKLQFGGVLLCLLDQIWAFGPMGVCAVLRGRLLNFWPEHFGGSGRAWSVKWPSFQVARSETTGESP